ncbi:carbohydrate ABC transporter permease [Desnuesiella massiliensis]|uniref:carbohydrate ABC transporter permease n=1 Tax=Desnuesiella massiliensis TaxID=1650662 RepID=UPI000A9CD082|nr:sugar ABC transporter permease [Desnuesiella massiliensis]
MKLSKWISKEKIAVTLFIAPSLIGFSIFYIIPFIIGVYYSFIDNAVNGSFVALKNYKELLSNSSFVKASSNTFIFMAIGIPLIIAISLMIAMALNKNLYFRNILRGAFILPLGVTVSSIIIVWQIFFDWNGVINQWISVFGIERVDWMKSEWGMWVLISIYIWKNIGYNIIIFLAGLQSIPTVYYEAAAIDGAGKFAKFKNITIVYLTPTMFLVVLMSMINAFKIFRETYLMAGDYPYDSIYMIQHYMNNMFTSLDMQKLTAAATLMFIVISLVVLILFFIERRFRKSME